MQLSIVDSVAEFVKSLSSLYDLPARKFIQTFLCGMIGSKSTLVTKIAAAISSPKVFKATYKRLDRRLGEVDLLLAYDRLQQQNFAQITDEHIIAIDMGDITKPHAKCLEGLAQVADGSEDHKIKPGYWLLGAVAVNAKSEDKTPIPLELKLHSSASEQCYSENSLILDFIESVYHATGNRGIFTIDRGGDRGRILQPLLELRAKFIIRLDKRHLTDLVEDKVIKISQRDLKRRDLPNEARLERRTRNGRRVPMWIRYDFKKVAINGLKKKVPHECFLVTAWSEKSKGPIELITSLNIETAAQALDVILNYLARWSVEDIYRFLKVSQALEEVQVRSLGTLKNVVYASFLVAVILAKLCHLPTWINRFQTQAYRQKTAPPSLYNLLYRAADVCAELLKRTLSRLYQFLAPMRVNYGKFL